MYKTTSKSMQKGGRDIPRKKPIIRHPRARATEEELRDFNTGETSKDDLLDQLRPVLKRMRGTTKPRPGQLAKLLNAEGWTTAQGRRWDERKVTLLLRLMAEQSARRRTQRAAAAPPKKPSNAASHEREPLSPEEIARRLSALGRIKG
jgi:hypothetical protein